MSDDTELNKKQPDQTKGGNPSQDRYRVWIWWLVACNVLALILLFVFAEGITEYKDWAALVVVGILSLSSLDVVIISALTSREMVEIMRVQEAEMTEQRRAMQEQRNIMERQATMAVAQAVYMRHGLNQTERQLKATEEIAFATNRGYLAVGLIAEPIFQETDHRLVQIEWHNTGNSPVRILGKSLFRIEIESEIPSSKKCTESAARGPVSDVVVNRDSPRVQVLVDHRGLTAADIARLKKEESFFCFCGTIYYETLGQTDQLDICSYWVKGGKGEPGLWFDSPASQTTEQQENPN